MEEGVVARIGAFVKKAPESAVTRIQAPWWYVVLARPPMAMEGTLQGTPTAWRSG